MSAPIQSTFMGNDVQTSAHKTDLFDDVATELATCPVAAMLERAADDVSRERVRALGRLIADMQANGYEIGQPVRVRRPTKYAYAEWHIPIKHAGAQCVLSFFINESLEVSNETQNRRRTAARPHSRHA